eukprot:m.27606 g.27606  ORF g.27606 m.27606 type:complete len:298 (+) comp7911_c0_seq4:125-1018(+)
MTLVTWDEVRKFIAGYASGVSLVLAGHPFDTIKVRMQSEGTGGRFRGVWHCLSSTVRNEGFRGLYKGMAAPLLMTGGVNSLLFGVQYTLVEVIANKRNHAKATLSDTMMAAVASGAFISIVVTPMEGIKARLQVQYAGDAAYKGPMDCARKVYKQLGLRHGIYRGWLPVALCRMSNYSYFGSYLFISSKLKEELCKSEDLEEKDKPLPFAAALAAGGCSGFVYWLSCYPIDVVKNRIQAAPDTTIPRFDGMRGAFREIYLKEGVRGFFVGFVPCVLRAFPANAAAFLGFEMAMRYLP